MNRQHFVCLLILIISLLPASLSASPPVSVGDPVLSRWTAVRNLAADYLVFLRAAGPVPAGKTRELLAALDSLQDSYAAYRREPVFSFMAASESSFPGVFSRMERDTRALRESVSSGASFHDVNISLSDLGDAFSAYMYFRIDYASQINRYYIYLILFFVIVCLLVIVLVSVFQARLRHSETKEANSADFARQIIQIQDTERVALARELHDTLAQDLLYIKLLSETMLRTLDRSEAGADPEFRHLIELETNCLNLIRQLCSELRPPELEHLGLNAALSELCHGFRTRANIDCHFLVSGSFALGTEGETHCYRIIQEALNNIRKHANATEVLVQLSLLPQDRLLLLVEDNGVGIPEGVLAGGDTSSWGLKGMRERVRILGGSMTIGVRRDGGTGISILIPLTDGIGDR